MIPLSSRLLEKQDYDYVKKIISESPEWISEECKKEDFDSYVLNYGMYNGKWRIWSLNKEDVGVSFDMEWSPANEKPWIGTLLIHPTKRLQGIGKGIINTIGNELSVKGHKVLFTGCPVNQFSWLEFIGKCGFEQFKVETEKLTSKDYMIMVKPL